MYRALILLITTLIAQAAETVPQHRPTLGITAAEAGEHFDGAHGVLVRAVSPGSNGERLGLRNGDVILAVSARELLGLPDLRAAVATFTTTDAVELRVRRGDDELTLGGMLRLPDPPAALGEREASLRERIAALEADDDPADAERYSLQDLLVILRQIERDLPAAAEEFKHVYPDGRFRIAIEIEIDSHTNAPSGETEPDADHPATSDEENDAEQVIAEPADAQTDPENATTP